MANSNRRASNLTIFAITKYYLYGTFSIQSFNWARNLEQAEAMPINWAYLAHIAFWIPFTRLGISLEINYRGQKKYKLVLVNLDKFR
jgi:hypothetical protein